MLRVFNKLLIDQIINEFGDYTGKHDKFLYYSMARILRYNLVAMIYYLWINRRYIEFRTCFLACSFYLFSMKLIKILVDVSLKICCLYKTARWNAFFVFFSLNLMDKNDSRNVRNASFNESNSFLYAWWILFMKRKRILSARKGTPFRNSSILRSSTMNYISFVPSVAASRRHDIWRTNIS